MNAVIRLEGVGFRYNRPRTVVFDDLNLALVYGTLQPQTGTIRIDQRAVPGYRDIFFLSERFGINQELSLRQNLEFRCRLFGVDIPPVLADPLIREFKLAKHIDKPCGKLSAGLFMRANIVAGLVFSPSLIMLDEPANSMDPATRELLLQVLKRQHDDGRTVALVTHDLEFAYEISHRLIVLDEGEIVIDDRNPGLTGLDEFRQAYLKFTEGTE